MQLTPRSRSRAAPERASCRPSPLGTATVAIRRLLARRPWIYWMIVLAMAAIVAAQVHAGTQRLDAARAEWGSTRAVVIAAEDAAPGDTLAVSVAELPPAVVPASAIDVSLVDDPIVARQRLAAGEIVSVFDVAGSAGPLALVPDGWLAVAVVESPASGAAVGERVQVASDGGVITDDALVVGHEGEATLVAVPEEVAALVPLAAGEGRLALLRQP